MAIKATFDPAILPEWARRDSDVVQFCKIDLAYRCAVCAATTPAVRSLLRNEARRVMDTPTY